MVSTMQIPIQGPSIASQIESLKGGEKTNAPRGKRNYIASLISGKLKDKYGDERAWTTYINPGNDQFLTIECTK